MPSRMLGKRTRVADEDDDSQTILTRSKRRLVVNGPNDENQNPFVRQDGVSANDATDTDEPRDKQKTRRAGKRNTVPAKHGAPEQRILLSPPKVSQHFKVRKPVVQVFEDGKSQTKSAPTTPRHHDALAKKVSVTPRHRVLVAGSRLATPGTPKTPGGSTSSVYQPVRQLFSRCCAPGKLLGREQERDELSAYISARLDSSTGGCLYVSGPPGTGKSTLVDEVTRQFGHRNDVVISTVNCMSVQNPKDLSTKLSEDLGLSEDAGMDYLRSCFSSATANDERKFLVILDEVDRLVDLDLSLLYSLFEWSMTKTSRLVLIGIANALDLTDRFLPRLKSRNLKPELLPFMPYTAAQIADVLTSKLKSLAPADSSVLPFLHPAAIQFCSKKVASQTGDLRKAFDICRRAIDLVELETRDKDAEAALQNSPSRTPLVENMNLSSPPTPRSPAKPFNLPTYTIDTAPKATIAHVARVTAQVFGNGTTQRLSTLNLQQKAVLCALSALEKRKRDTQVERTMFATPSKHNASAPSIKQLFEAYSTLCKHDNLFHALSSIEFRDVLSGLETLSLVSRVDAGGAGSFAIPITPSRTPGRRPKNGFGKAAVGDERRVASAFGTQELLASLNGPGGELLKDMLEGDGLL